MARSRARLVIISLPLLSLVAIAAAASQLPMLGASGLLHPVRYRVASTPPRNCRDVRLSGAGVELAAWKCQAAVVHRGTLIYLHGVADNRGSSVGVIQRFSHLGFDVIAYDSRAHGDSGGAVCTYGFWEREDLRKVLDTIDTGPIVLLGTSLGAAVALQLAAEDDRVSAVVAAETFSDLRTVVTERAPFFFTPGVISRAFELAERQGDFRVDSVNPAATAVHIAVPVLLIHGDADTQTPPHHSRRVFDKLGGPRRLVLVKDAGHNGSLTPDTWEQIERWVLALLDSEKA